MMPTRERSYGSGCIAAHALDIVGDRWALLVVRELMLGPRRFGAIRATLPGIATNILTARLEQLEAAGVIERLVLSAPAGAPGYGLTPSGEALWPVLAALCRWGAAMPGHDSRLPISPSSLMLSMRAQMMPAAAREGGDREAAFDLDGEGFLVTIRDGRHQVVRSERPRAEVAFGGHPNAVAVAVYGPRPVADLARAGSVTLTGDPERAQGFLDLFSLQPAPERIES